ncbi:MAG: DUF1700 domain-containing protein [Christensenellaceae bacterium]|jgi:uncharacterized membrane protein
MTISEFLTTLEAALAALPKEEREKSLSYYHEILLDRMEEGMSEAAATESLGAIPLIAQEILAEFPPQEKKSSPWRENKILFYTLLVLASPFVFAFFISGVVILLSCYIVIWAFIISFFAIVVSLALSGIGVLIITLLSFPSEPFIGIWLLGAAFILIALSMFSFYPAIHFAKWATKEAFT